VLTAATDVEYTVPALTYQYDPRPYEKRVYNGFGRPDPSVELRFGPNITDLAEDEPPGGRSAPPPLRRHPGRGDHHG
jgi:aconitate hydratase